MKDKLLELADKLNAISPRERVILLVVVIVAMLGVYDHFALTPYLDQRKENDKLFSQYVQEMSEIEAKISEVTKKMAHDPNAILKERIAKQEQQLAKLDSIIGESTQNLIEPKKMSQVLGYLLSKQSGMGVKSVKNHPAEPVSFQKDEESKPEVLMYRHRLELGLEGTFFQVAGYLKMIEGLEERLYWDRMEFSIDQYPKGEFVLDVHTLSMSKELIGVYE